MKYWVLVEQKRENNGILLNLTNFVKIHQVLHYTMYKGNLVLSGDFNDKS